jgi:hypothetical protein
MKMKNRTIWWPGWPIRGVGIGNQKKKIHPCRRKKSNSKTGRRKNIFRGYVS